MFGQLGGFGRERNEYGFQNEDGGVGRGMR